MDNYHRGSSADKSLRSTGLEDEKVLALLKGGKKGARKGKRKGEGSSGYYCPLKYQTFNCVRHFCDGTDISQRSASFSSSTKLLRVSEPNVGKVRLPDTWYPNSCVTYSTIHVTKSDILVTISELFP
jgi:hypothetical protein